MSNNSRKSHCNIQHTITTHTEKATTQNNNDHARPDKAVTRHTNINTKTASKYNKLFVKKKQNMVIWQPPLSVFDSTSPYFTGDIGIILTPNSNWRTSASAVGDYNSDVQHGVDYAFGVKSLRFYIARTRITEDIPRQVTMTMKDFIVTNKQMMHGLFL
jgi:hypothetical protein